MSTATTCCHISLYSQMKKNKEGNREKREKEKDGVIRGYMWINRGDSDVFSCSHHVFPPFSRFFLLSSFLFLPLYPLFFLLYSCFCLRSCPLLCLSPFYLPPCHSVLHQWLRHLLVLPHDIMSQLLPTSVQHCPPITSFSLHLSVSTNLCVLVVTSPRALLLSDHIYSLCSHL